LKTALVLILTLAAGPVFAAPTPAPNAAQRAEAGLEASVPRQQADQIAALHKQVDDANKKGAYWMMIAQAALKELHAHDDADLPLIAFPQQPQPGGPQQ